MDYTPYTATDFATEDSFIRWVKTGNKELDLFWTQWLKDHPEKTKEIEAAKRLIKSIHIQDQDWSAERQADLKKRILAAAQSTMSMRRQRRLWLQRIAAVITGTLVLSASAWFLLQNEPLIYETGYGITQEIVLPDHSRVVLNANSRLQYQEPWWGNKREVTLTGEAFFQVTKQADSSVFTIKSGGIITEVLGTEFSIRSRRDTIQVVLTAGRVQLSPQTENATAAPIVMQPGELVEYADTKMVRKEEVDTALYAGLRQHMLIFKQTSLADVAQQVKDLYGYALHFPPVLNDQSFTAKVPLTMGGLTVLKSIIAESFNVKITRETNSAIYFEK